MWTFLSADTALRLKLAFNRTDLESFLISIDFIYNEIVDGPGWFVDDVLTQTFPSRDHRSSAE